MVMFLSTFLDRGNETVFQPRETGMTLSARDRESLKRFAAIVVTGASSGIGRCLAQTMSECRPDGLLLSVSRRAPLGLMTSLKHASVDLSKPDGPETAAAFVLTEILQLRQPGPILLVNNSGFGAYGAFPAPNPERHTAMINLNTLAPVALMARLLPILRERGGAVLNVASVAGFLPTPYLATYGATKAFLLHWSLALGEELRSEGIRVTTLCPGPTQTRFFAEAGFAEPPATGYASQSAEEVAIAALRGIARGKRLVVTGLQNRLVFGLAQMLPRGFAAGLSGRVLRRLRLERFKQAAGDASGGDSGRGA